MIEKITKEELEIFETLCNPVSCTEILFSDFDNLAEFDEEKFGKVRLFQYPYLGYDTLFIENSSLTKKENFKIKKGFSEVFVLGGRLTGKTLFAVIVDVIISIFHKTFAWGVVSSLDHDHVKGVLEKIIVALENHSVLKLLGTSKKTTRNPYKIVSENGCLLESVNNNLVGKNPGQHWFGKHIDKNWEEEASFLTKQITNKKLMAQSELGCIFRYSGMTTFAKQSPMGEIFYDLRNKLKIINLPSYVNPTWDDEKDERAILEFGGKNSAGYQVQIQGKVIENSDSVYDIERIRDTYIRNIPIKAFEINKNNFFRYKEILIIERPNNAESCTIAMDIGEGGAPTEIIVLFKINGIYKYTYNITTFKLAPEEEKELVKYIIEILKANIVGVDVTSGGGKYILSYLATFYANNVFGVSFNEKIPVDWERDENNQIKYDNKGQPIYKTEYVIDWSVQRLKHLFYNNKIKCLMDFKLDQQFDGIIVMKSGQRTIYGSKVANHLHQAFQVFAIVDWMSEFLNLESVEPTKLSLGVFKS